MAYVGRTFTREDVKQFLGLGKKIVFGSVGNMVSGLQKTFNPEAKIPQTLKVKYDALISANFSEEEAFKIVMSQIEARFKEAIGEKEGV